MTASSTSARAAARSSPESARAVSSTARPRRKVALSIRPLFMLESSAASAPAQSPCAQRKSSTAWAAQATAGLACTASSATVRAAAMSFLRCASTKRPCSPSSLVSPWSAMRRKITSAAGRLPASWAVCAPSSSASGSSPAKRLASPAKRRAALTSPGADRDQPARDRLPAARERAAWRGMHRRPRPGRARERAAAAPTTAGSRHTAIARISSGTGGSGVIAEPGDRHLAGLVGEQDGGARHEGRRQRGKRTTRIIAGARPARRRGRDARASRSRRGSRPRAPHCAPARARSRARAGRAPRPAGCQPRPARRRRRRAPP